MRVIFLDIDGVLNSEEFYQHRPLTQELNEIDEEKVKLLQQIVQATNAKIVLTSTWRVYDKTDKTSPSYKVYGYLVDTLAKYDLSIFDCTPWINENRPHEIQVWLSMWDLYKDIHEHIRGYVILDDDFSHKQYAKFHLQNHLIKTTFYGERGGLQPEHVQQAIDILEGRTMKNE